MKRGRTGTNCPSCILSLEKGLELMQESGEPMEFGIFDFPRCFQGLFVRRVMGQRGLRMGDVVIDLGPEVRRHQDDDQEFCISISL